MKLMLEETLKEFIPYAENTRDFSHGMNRNIILIKLAI